MTLGESGNGTFSYAAYDVAGNILGLAALPLLPLLLLTRHGRGLGERLGRLPPAIGRLRRPVWVHAASVGEVFAAEPLIAQLRQKRPDLQIVVSTTSLTGREAACTHLAVDAAMLLPADIGWIVDRALRDVRPRCLIIMETEIWPALLRAAARQGVPVVMVSGRVSARAAARYSWIRWLTRTVLSQVSAFAMQTEADAARLVTLGAPVARVRVVGSLKFARAATPRAASEQAPASETAALVEGRPLVIAASTHPGEEQMVLDACATLWKDQPTLLLLIAPRRPERFDEVGQLLERTGLTCERRSQLRGPVPRATQILLLDTVGELPDVFPAARAVFVGGTIASVGGHNVLEPALFGKPVAFGPHTANVETAARALLDRGAATQVRDAQELHAEWRRLLAQPEVAQEMGARGRAVVASRAAVAEQTFEVVRPFLDDGV